MNMREITDLVETNVPSQDNSGHLYHGTDKEFDKFAPNSHFGTEAQAKMRQSKQIIPVMLRTTKFKRLRDTGDWKPANLRRYRRQGYDGIVYLNRYEGIPWAELAAAAHTKMPTLDHLSDSQFKKLIPSAQDSYIVFDPFNVKRLDRDD